MALDGLALLGPTAGGGALSIRVRFQGSLVTLLAEGLSAWIAETCLAMNGPFVAESPAV